MKLNFNNTCRKDGIVVNAVNNQFKFIKKVFIPIVNGIKQSALHMSPIILGSLFGKNRSSEFEKVETSTINGAYPVSKDTFPQTWKKPKPKPAVISLCRSSFSPSMVQRTLSTINTWTCTFGCIRFVQMTNTKIVCIMIPRQNHTSTQFENVFAICPNQSCEAQLEHSVHLHSSRIVRDCMYQCFKYIIELHPEERQFEPNVQMKRFPR